MERNKIKRVKTPFGYKVIVGAMRNVGINKVYKK